VREEACPSAARLKVVAISFNHLKALTECISLFSQTPYVAGRRRSSIESASSEGNSASPYSEAEEQFAAVGSKRRAEEELADDTRPCHRLDATTTNASNPSDRGVSPVPSRQPAPGATQAAIARLAGANGARTADSRSSTPPGGPSRKVPTPGATQAAIARLANLGAAGSSARSGANGGQGRVPTPGATQAAMARLAALRNGSGAASGPTAIAIPPAAPAPPAVPLLPGAVVWAKMPSYPWWPAQVQRPTAEQSRIKHSPGDVFVVFYGE
jgi:hypothetical protein